MDLTSPQQRVLDTFRDAARSGAAPPTYRELCDRFGWTSTATARDHLSALVRKGCLHRESGARNYRLTEAVERGTFVPLVGRVAAGRPILAIEHRVGDVQVPEEWMLGSMFAVRVEGESMTGAGILDGDTLVVRATNEARDGDVVVARMGDDVTVKRLRMRSGRPWLMPENPAFRPIAIDEGTELEGIVVGLLRALQSRRIRRGTRWAR